MANELQLLGGTSGGTYDAIIRNSAFQPRNLVTPAFEAYNAANYASYVTALSEQGATGNFFADMPAGIGAGTYSVDFRQRTDPVTPAEGDSNAGVDVIIWDGSLRVVLDLNQLVPITDLTAKIDQTVGDCLSAARADGAGAANGNTGVLLGPDGSVVRTFAISGAGTVRT